VRKIDVVSSVFSCKRSRSDSRVGYIEGSGKNVSWFSSSSSREDGSDDLNGAAENVQAVNVTFCDNGHTIGMGDQSRILHFSLASQIDGLIYALLGIRLERDALASTQATSLCQFYGCEEFVPWSAYSMLYVPRFDNATINSMLARAAAQKVIGVFVLPVWTGQIWYQQLLHPKTCTRRLLFKLPRDCFTSVVSSAPILLTYGVIALVLDFGFIGRLKTKRRPEK
jgi:hypothetical protein